ncbi:MAG: DUF6089 family protein [Bacteroidota bacterium]
MKRIYFIVFIALIGKANAQDIDVGVGLGLANYWGDLAPSIAWGETKPAGNIFARYNFNTSWAVTGQISALQVSGSDKNFDYNQVRNLNFTSNITEFSSLFEFNFLKYGYGVLDSKFTGYVFGGISMFSFNPQTRYAGQTINLRDVKTEGVAYGTYSFAIPFGIGVKYIFRRNYSLEANLNFRRTYTDYLDDVSTKYADLSALSIATQQIADRSYEVIGVTYNRAGYKRGNPDYNDWFMTLSASLVYRIPGRIKCNRFY